MAQYCTIINILAPANIISTDMVLDKINCIEPCTVEIIVTWQNTGDVTGQFTPSIIVDSDIPITLDSEQLNEGQTVSHTFTVSNLMIGTHTIRSYPTGVDPKTIEVTSAPIAEAGFNEKERFIIVGLYMGLAFKAIEKWNNMRTEKIR